MEVVSWNGGTLRFNEWVDIPRDLFQEVLSTPGQLQLLHSVHLATTDTTFDAKGHNVSANVVSKLHPVTSPY